ncbi:16S rRNA (guanine(966)-N(2))-methyltransferase RsmD [Dokdonella sp.]|uniref:16S rRNA (guanine(966)-N(2))-methyltransferase RsmD n=1 Tax=Dokdonella sp. TaxID=2291710 RepID=UPI002F403ED2
MRNPPPKPAHGAVRIVAGRLRGSRLAVPVREGLRPTPDRVRETLFNWLMPYLPGMRCLDLYAGTGALGIEALSRGAGSCTFIERDRELCRALADNVVRLRVEGAEVVHADAAGWLTGAARPYDLVFLDPPFDAGLWQGAAAAIEQGGWLADGGFAYVESPREARFELPPAWLPHREGFAGAVRFALYRRSGAVPLS